MEDTLQAEYKVYLKFREYRSDTEAECILLIYTLETLILDTSSTFACNKWEQK